MRFTKLAVGLLFSSAVLAAPAVAATTVAAAPRFTSITVFGDSLVDAGNVFTLTGGARPAAERGYFQGRFTNGFDYTDLLSIALFGTPTVASLQGGTNFAFGGARATTTSQVPDLLEQFGLFSASGQQVDRTGLYVLNFGGNDIFAALGAGAPVGFESDEAYLRQAASIYAGGVQTLASLGAQNILITGFPVSTGAGLTFSLQAEGFLTSALATLDLAPGTNLFRFSYVDFFQRLRADPTAFGLPSNLSFTTTCQQAAALPDCTGFFSFDGTHPTAAVQRAAFNDINGQFNLTGAVPEPATWAMMIGGFGMVGGAMRSARRKQKVSVSYA